MHGQGEPDRLLDACNAHTQTAVSPVLGENHPAVSALRRLTVMLGATCLTVKHTPLQVKRLSFSEKPHFQKKALWSQLKKKKHLVEVRLR